MLAKIRKNLTKKLKKKMKGFLMIQTALALITLGAMAVSFFQIYGGQFAAMAAARNGSLAQQAADIVAEYYQMADYDSLSSSTIPKSGTLATLFGTGNLSSDLANLKFSCELGAEKNFTTSDGTNSGNLRLATIKIMNSDESAPRATVTVPLSSAGVGSYYVKNDTKKTAGITSVKYSGGYLYGYVNGTQYPFYFDGYTKTQSDTNYYKKSQTYTQAQVNALIKGLQDKITELENNSGNGVDYSKAENLIKSESAQAASGWGILCTQTATGTFNYNNATVSSSRNGQNGYDGVKGCTITISVKKPGVMVASQIYSVNGKVLTSFATGGNLYLNKGDTVVLRETTYETREWGDYDTGGGYSNVVYVNRASATFFPQKAKTT